MKRTQIQLDEPTYRALRQAAHDRGQSMAAVAREAIARGLEAALPKRLLTMKDFEGMIGIGASDQGSLSPVSVNHDEALAEILYEDIRRGQEGYEELLKRRSASAKRSTKK